MSDKTEYQAPEQQYAPNESSSEYVAPVAYKFKDKPKNVVRGNGVNGCTKSGTLLFMPNMSVYAQQELLSKLGKHIGVEHVELMTRAENPMPYMTRAIMNTTDYEGMVILMHEVISLVRIDGKDKLVHGNVDTILEGNLGYAIELFCWAVGALYSDFFGYVLEEEV